MIQVCQNCGRTHEGPLWETFIDGDNKPLELLLCGEPRYKEEDDKTKEKAEDKTYENEETPSETDTDRHKGYDSQNYDWQEEVKYDNLQKGRK